jgi:hypothetical protein
MENLMGSPPKSTSTSKGPKAPKEAKEPQAPQWKHSIPRLEVTRRREGIEIVARGDSAGEVAEHFMDAILEFKSLGGYATKNEAELIKELQKQKRKGAAIGRAMKRKYEG